MVSQAVIDAYAQCLHVSPDRAATLIAALAGNQRDVTNANNTFTAAKKALRPAIFRSSTEIAHNYSARDIAHIAGGSFGSIWRSPGGYVYKVVGAPSAGVDDAFYRGVFLEVFIQVLLRADPDIGSFIPQIHGLYRMGYSDSMVIAMEDVPTSFLSFLESRAPLTRANLLTFMKPIAQILTVAGERYGFRHGDLHWGNLMFAADGSPKLIDFGKSCVTVDGVTYAATPANCESYDMLILYASLLERASFQPSQFTTDAVEMLRSLFHGTDGIDYYQTLLNWFTAMKGKISATALFHVFYHDVAIGLNSPSEPDWAIRRRQPWTLVLELTRLAKPGEKTFYDAFVAAGIPAATEPAAMVISLDAMKGGRLNVTRRQPKAARRFKQ